MADEAKRTEDYRQARRDFIAAAGQAGKDAIARVHPAKGPDGRPLFCDCAGFGPRDAKNAVLVTGGPLALAKLAAGLPDDTRLVLVHALDPLAASSGQADRTGWTARTLADIAVEELRSVRKLALLDADGSAADLRSALEKALPAAKIVSGTLDAATAAQTVGAAIAALRGSGV